MLLRIVIPNIKRIIIPPRLWPPFLQDFNTLDAQQPTVFLAWTSNDLKAKREGMAMVLTRAGFQVIPNYDCPSSDEDFKSNVQKNLDQASCSLHILSGEFGRRFEEEDEISYPKYQFDMAKNKSAMSGSKFTTFKEGYARETDELLSYYAEKQRTSKKELYETWLNSSGFLELPIVSKANSSQNLSNQFFFN